MTWFAIFILWLALLGLGAWTWRAQEAHATGSRFLCGDNRCFGGMA